MRNKTTPGSVAKDGWRRMQRDGAQGSTVRSRQGALPDMARQSTARKRDTRQHGTIFHLPCKPQIRGFYKKIIRITPLTCTNLAHACTITMQKSLLRQYRAAMSHLVIPPGDRVNTKNTQCVYVYSRNTHKAAFFDMSGKQYLIKQLNIYMECVANLQLTEN